MKFTGELREQEILIFFFTLTPPPPIGSQNLFGLGSGNFDNLTQLDYLVTAAYTCVVVSTRRTKCYKYNQMCQCRIQERNIRLQICYRVIQSFSVITKKPMQREYRRADSCA